MKINIIGAGMAGSILAKLLRKDGIEFNIFDNECPGRASIISENLIGKTWYEKELTKESLEILRSIVPVREIKSGKFEAYHVYTKDLLEQEYIKAEAMPMQGNLTIAYKSNQTAEFQGINVICAGIWTPTIADVKVTESVGHGLLFGGQHEESISLWAPFRYQKLIQRNPNEIWFSDSMSVSRKTYQKNPDRFINALLNKSRKFPNLLHGTYCVGYRPVTDGHVNLKVPNGYVITGGNKAGLLHYPIQCKQLIETLKTQL